MKHRHLHFIKVSFRSQTFCSLSEHSQCILCEFIFILPATVALRQWCRPLYDYIARSDKAAIVGVAF